MSYIQAKRLHLFEIQIMRHNNSYAAIYDDQSLNQGGDYSSQSAMQHQTSSVPLRRRKEFQSQLLHQSQSNQYLTLADQEQKNSRKTSGGRSNRIGTKENTASFSNMHYDFIANSSQMLPPTSTSMSQSRKSAKSKKKEKARERDKDLQMQALQLQFMQETLLKLQKEKQTRADALKSTMQRRNSSKGIQPQQVTAVKSGRNSQKSSSRLQQASSQNELKKSSRAIKPVTERTPRSGSRKASKATAAQKAVQSPPKSRHSSSSQTRIRTHPRLCELSQAEFDTSVNNMPRQIAPQKGSQGRISANIQLARSRSPVIPTSGNSKKQIKGHKILMAQKYQKHAESIRKANDLNQTGLTAQLEQSSARPVKRKEAGDSQQVAVRSFFKSQQSSMHNSMIMPSSKFKSRSSNQLQMSVDQGGQVNAASQELLKEDSEISELTQEYEEVVCEAPLQIQCLENDMSSTNQTERHHQQHEDRQGASPNQTKMSKKSNQKDRKDSIDASRSKLSSIDQESQDPQSELNGPKEEHVASNKDDHTATNKDERHSMERPEAVEYHRRPQSQAAIHPLSDPQIISERQLSSCGAQNHSSRQQDIADFFEKEYKNSQKDLLVAKAHLYEQQFKTELLKKKIVEYEQVQSQMNEELTDLRLQLSQKEAQSQAHETHNESQSTYTRDLEGVKAELLKIQEQSANEMERYEQAVKQMTIDQAGDLKKQRQFVKDLVSEISDVEALIAASQLSSRREERDTAGFEDIQRGKLACKFNQIYKILKSLNDEIISRKKQLGRTNDIKKLLNTMQTSRASDAGEQYSNQAEFDIGAARAQSAHDFLAQDPFKNQNYVDKSSQERSQPATLQLSREPSSLKTKQQYSQNSFNSKSFAGQTQQQLQLMTSMNQNLVTEARTITNDGESAQSAAKVGMEIPTPSMGNHQTSSKVLDFAHQNSQDQHLQQQQQLASMVHKLQADLGDVKQQSAQLLALNQTLAEENRELRQLSNRNNTERSNQRRSPTMRAGSESDRRTFAAQQSPSVDEENQALQQEKKQLLALVESLKTSQKSQDVMIQYLQGTQNSILQKMQHNILKNQFSQSLVESAALATSFLQKDSLPMISNTNSSGEKYNSTISNKQTPDGGADASSSLDLKYFMAQKQQDISASIRAYENERGTETSLNLTGDQKRIGDGHRFFSGGSQSPSLMQEYLPDTRQRSELNIIDETAEGVYRDLNNSSTESKPSHRYGEQPDSCGNGIDAHQDYDSKTLSEHNRQHVQQQRGISPVTQIRKVDSRKSLSYQKQASSVKVNDMSVVSLSHLNSNSKQIPEQMRQLLRLQSSQDGTENERYLETGAFEKRSGGDRLFSLDSTAQQDHLLPADDLSGQNIEERGEMSPVKDLNEANDFQSNQLLNLVQCMQDASAQGSGARLARPWKQGQVVQSPHRRSPSLEDMKQKIIFSAELTKSDERISALSSPEMDLLTQSDPSGLTTQNQSIKHTRGQREIEQIIALTKFSQQQALPNLHVCDYSSQQVDKLALQARQNSSLARAIQNAECLSQLQQQVKSPSFHQPDVSLTLPLLSKEETTSGEQQTEKRYSDKVDKVEEHELQQVQDGDQEVEVEHLMPRHNVKASMDLPRTSNMPMAAQLMYQPQSMSRQNMNISELTNYDEKSCTTMSASNRHNIRRSGQPEHARTLHNSALTSHETTMLDNLLQRENTQGCGAGERLVTASLQHMPTQQYMPTQKIATHPLGANQSVMYSPFKTHACHFTQQGSFPFSRSRSTSPNQNEASGLAASSDRIQKRTQQMQQEINSIDKEIAQLQSDIGR